MRAALEMPARSKAWTIVTSICCVDGRERHVIVLGEIVEARQRCAPFRLDMSAADVFPGKGFDRDAQLPERQGHEFDPPSISRRSRKAPRCPARFPSDGTTELVKWAA